MRKTNSTDRRESRLRSILLLVHGLLYAGCWILALQYLSTLNLSDSAFHAYTMGILAALLWMPLFILHVAIHTYLSGRRSSDERAIYREGFMDAMSQMADRSYETARLTLDDEGELVEVKRKRDQA
jgi:hypothetical protein